MYEFMRKPFFRQLVSLKVIMHSLSKNRSNHGHFSRYKRKNNFEDVFNSVIIREQNFHLPAFLNSASPPTVSQQYPKKTVSRRLQVRFLMLMFYHSQMLFSIILFKYKFHYLTVAKKYIR